MLTILAGLFCGLIVLLLFVVSTVPIAFAFGWFDAPTAIEPIAPILVQESERPFIPINIQEEVTQDFPPTLRPRVRSEPAVPIRSLADRKRINPNHKLEIINDEI